ncbi:MAG: glycerol-3-phosphate dehydrogenase/oxidase [Anaerolineales bacterium]|jgi:glycerol-3-phosphate dehydrogenase
MQPREDRLRRLRENSEVSVLVVGAGINGIGTFRDLALQGVDVVLVDRGDYCCGASAASSHMVHGGIRYLENGEFRLVQEAVQERNLLIENAPHLVKPLPTTFPIFKWFSGLLNAPLKFFGLLERPSERGAVVIKFGMMLYDYFTRKQKTVPKHVFRNREESLARFPELNPEVIYTGTYYDGAMPSPERIAIEVLKDAVEMNEQALALNYVSLVSAENDTVILKDEISEETFELKPKILVNAAGPWIDLVNRTMGKQTTYISGTKGSHLILDHPGLRQAIGDHEFFFENDDGRIVLIFPLFDKVMIGTSDILIDHPDDAIITEEEVDYFFEMIGRVFPDIQVDRSQIVYTFSGVRPLQHSEGKTTGQISRDHKVQINEIGDPLMFPVLSLVGGKWTSFRAFSELAADIILNRLGLERKISTRNLEIGGSKGYPRNNTEKEAYFVRLKQDYQIDLEQIEELFEVYGTKTETLLQEQGAAASEPLKSIPDICNGELSYIVANEDVLHLDDLILRRTMLGKLGRITPDSLREIAQICAWVLDWSEEYTEEQIDRLNALLRHEHKMNFNAFLGG